MKKTVILIALFPTILFGRNNADSLKLEIIKATVNFYATDGIAYPSLKNKKLSCKGLDYQCITDFCNQNNVQSILEKVNIWKNDPCNSANDLKNISDKIEKELTKKEINKDREYRKFLNSYNPYLLKVSQLIELYHEYTSASIGKSDSNSHIIMVGGQPIPRSNPVPPSLPKDESQLPLIALIFSLLAILISMLTVRRKIKSSSQSISTSVSEVIQIRHDIKELNSKFSQKPNNEIIIRLEDKLKNIETRLQKLENISSSFEFRISEKEVSSSQTPKLQFAFAKLPDLGNGFSQSIVLSSQNGEQIYEIEIDGNQAKYSIAMDVNAQKYALSDYNYYLSNACDFQNQPVKNCRIKTNEKGTLLKSSGSWIIQKKAKIEFN